MSDPLTPAETQRPADAPAADDSLHREQERARLWRALREVPPEFRTALVLFDIEGHSYDEVAAVEGVPVGTVKSRLSRGRAHLRRILGEPPAPESATDAGTSQPAPSSNLPGRGT
jgi:RNA polymerase sigma-70 factor (ECF subfamily)